MRGGKGSRAKGRDVVCRTDRRGRPKDERAQSNAENDVDDGAEHGPPRRHGGILESETLKKRIVDKVEQTVRHESGGEEHAGTPDRSPSRAHHGDGHEPGRHDAFDRDDAERARLRREQNVHQRDDDEHRAVKRKRPRLTRHHAESNNECSGDDSSENQHASTGTNPRLRELVILDKHAYRK